MNTSASVAGQQPFLGCEIEGWIRGLVVNIAHGYSLAGMAGVVCRPEIICYKSLRPIARSGACSRSHTKNMPAGLILRDLPSKWNVQGKSVFALGVFEEQ